MQTSNHDVIRQKIAKVEKQLASLKVQQAQAEGTHSSLKEQLQKLQNQLRLNQIVLLSQP